MVKPDVKHNYYSDLELPPTASIDDIRRAYRKLALQYHPDRNAGREAECVPRFQAIQTANEVLSDPNTKSKYDQDRQRAGINLSNVRSAGQTGNPYKATSAYPPPPRRTQPGQWQRPSPAQGPGQSTPSGAERFTNFPRPASHASSKTPAAGRSQAWQNMNGQQNPGVPPRRQPPQPTPPRQEQNPQPKTRPGMPTEEKIRANFRNMAPPAPDLTSAWQHRKANWGPDTPPPPKASPGLGRSNTQRTPRRTGGFDPAAPGSDERPAPAAGSHYSHRHRSEDFTSPRSEFPPPPPGPPPGADPVSPLSTSSQRSHNATSPLRPPFRSHTTDEKEVPYSEGNRKSTPYSSGSTFVGEKTQFTSPMYRSASSKDTTKLNPESARYTRARSISPSSKQPPVGTRPRPFVQYSSSEESSEERPFSSTPDEFDGSDGAKERMRTYSQSAAHDRPKKTPAPPSRRANGASQTDGASADPQAAEEMPSMQQRNSGTNMYVSPFPHVHSHSSTTAQSAAAAAANAAAHSTARRSGRGGSQRNRAVVPRWAMPSSINPDLFVKEKVLGDRLRSDSYGDAWSGNDRSAAALGKNSETLQSFTVPFSHPPSATGTAKSRSEENINTNFTPGGWSGTFTGSNEYFPPPPTSSRKASPMRRSTQRNSTRAATTDVPPGSSDSSPYDSVPPPFGSDGDQHVRASPTSTTFNHEDWTKTFKDANWVVPPPPPNPPRPAQHPQAEKASNGFKEGAGSIHDASRDDAASETAWPSKAAVTEDDFDAMDIDAQPPANPLHAKQAAEAQTRNARPVSVPMPKWRLAHDKAGNEKAPPSTQSPQQQEETDVNLNMNQFRTSQPFGRGLDEGLHSLADLSSELPFSSQPAAQAPHQSVKPQVLETPPVPQAPEPPSRMTKTLWRVHAQNFGRYLEAYHAFNRTMVTHFDAREKQSAARMLSGLGWLEATGDGSDNVGGFSGFGNYWKGVQEDEAVRETWRIGCERHYTAVQKFANLREQVKRQVVANALPDV